MDYKTLFNKDLYFGLKSENENLDVLNKFFNSNLKKTKNKYHHFDFKDRKKKILVELKTRKNMTIKTYPSLMVSHSKFKYALKKIKKGYMPFIVWCLNDGLYCYKITTECETDKWLSENLIKNEISRTDRGRIERCDNVYIDVKEVYKI